ncbi:hypothetical protein D3C76_461250 [compost metagenome]
MFGQMTDQRLFAIQFSRRLLQQFGQVQQVGQDPLAVAAGDERARQLEVVQQVAQHRQHALALPDFAVAAETHHPVFPHAFVLVEAVKREQRQVERKAGQCGFEQALGVGFGTGLEPGQHIMGFLGGEHRVLVGQVHAAHVARSQFGADQLRLGAVAHEDGDVRWQAGAQRTFAIAEARRALLPTIEQRHDMAGATGRHLLTVKGAGHRLLALPLPALQGGARLAVDQQLLATPFGTDLDEGQRVIVGFAEQERSTSCAARLGLQEHLIDRRDHGLAGAIVGVQAVQPTCGRPSCRQVGVDIGAAEGVDRLLRIANHEQAGFRAVLGDAVDALEDPVLDRIGVLEFIDQRYRKLLTDDTGQALACLAGQGVLQAQEHVVEAHFGTSPLFHFEARRDPRCGVFEQAGFRADQGLQLLLQRLHGMQGRVIRRLTRLPGFSQTCRGQAGEAGAQIELRLLVITGPGA